MGLAGVTALAILVAVSYATYKILEIPDTPVLTDQYWGPGEEKTADTSIRPFKVQVDDKVLKDLKLRLENFRSQPPLEGIHFQYGFNTDTLSKIIKYWSTKYDWRQREVNLNKYPQFKTNIQGLDIHYIHVKPQPKQGVKVVPLILLHGWPGSVREFYETIPLLTATRENENFVFEVIIPSLPGYGFSDAAAKPGLGAAQMAVIFKNLMNRIGFEKFYVQGGDWGAAIVAYMATLFPQNVIGLHSNMCAVNNMKSNVLLVLESLFPSLFIEPDFMHKVYPLSKRFSDLLEETGYMHIQATKPDTVGVGLNDSPAGLAAYILEKFSTATDPAYRQTKDGGLTEKFTYDHLLDNVMIYWITKSFTSSARLYAETLNKGNLAFVLNQIPISMEVPCACMYSPHEIVFHPEHIVRLKYPNLIQRTLQKTGGHFAALENPKMFAEDVWTAISKMEKWRASRNS